MYKCTKCSAEFSSRDELRKHQFGHMIEVLPNLEINTQDSASKEEFLKTDASNPSDVDIKGNEWVGLKNASWTDGGINLQFLYDPNNINNLDPSHICANAGTYAKLHRNLIKSGPVHLGDCSDGGSAWRILVQVRD